MTQQVEKTLSRKLGQARLALFIEQFWPAVLPVLMVLIGFAAVSLFGLWRTMPVWLHGLLLLGFAAGLGYSLYRAWRTLRLPRRNMALARLERDSGIRHEALRALEDELPQSVDDPETKAFWQAHRSRLREKLLQLRVALPSSDLALRDPWALRAIPVLILVLALVEGWGDIRNRFGDALTFARSPAAAAEPILAELWITPPDYTRRAPLGPAQTANSPKIVIPEGSEALLQLQNVPVDEDGLQARVLFGSDAMPLEALGRGSARSDFPMTRSGEIVFALGAKGDGEVIARWPVEVVPDGAPKIAFAETPGATQRGVLRIDYEASDDHGLTSVVLEFKGHQIADTTVHERGLSEPASLPTELKSSSFLDLTAHRLAGLPVQMTLKAQDRLDQEGRSEPLIITLPERVFTHPLAKAVIQQRKRLVTEPEETRSIAGRLSILGDSEAARQLPVTVPLSLRVASSRLILGDGQPEAIGDVIDILWELALFIEDGTMSIAERELRELQQALQEAMDQGASDEELAQLMDEIERAMNEMLQEMMRQAMQNPQQMNPEMMQEIDPSQMVTQRDLQEMLDKARELMKQGMMDAAREMMAQLQNMLENMQMAMSQMQQQPPSPAEEAVSDLQRMIEMQQDLLDRSFDMNRQMQGQQGQQGQQNQQQGQGQQGQGQEGMGEQGQGQQGQGLQSQMGRAAMEQDALRRALGELMRRMGEAGMELPRSLGQAELQMRDARGALEQGQPDPAAGSQTSALDLMRQGGQAMMEQLREQLANQPGRQMTGQPMPSSRQGRDPLGRAQRNQGGFDTYGTQVPDENDLGRARDVLEELYRRSGDLSRPPSELNYIDRLLDRF